MLRLLWLFGALAAPIPLAHANEAKLPIELNKLEERDGGCRMYLVMENKADRAFDALKLDLVLFGADGVIARRMAVETAPLRADKTTVKLFDVAGLSCSGIGGVLINDVMNCRAGDTEIDDCIGRLEPASRAAVPLSK